MLMLRGRRMRMGILMLWGRCVCFSKGSVAGVFSFFLLFLFFLLLEHIFLCICWRFLCARGSVSCYGFEIPCQKCEAL